MIAHLVVNKFLGRAQVCRSTNALRKIWLEARRPSVLRLCAKISLQLEDELTFTTAALLVATMVSLV